MNVIETKLSGVLIIEPKVFGDVRGFFMETWQAHHYRDIGIAEPFVQDNLSSSTKGVLRGLHFQNPHGQGKLVSVVHGAVFDVAVDIRVNSPTFGQWTGVTLSGENHKQFWIPAGFAHGFCVLSETAVFAYKCTDVYTPSTEGGVRWDDPDLGIEWPITDVLLSDKDEAYPFLRDIPKARFPHYEG